MLAHFVIVTVLSYGQSDRQIKEYILSDYYNIILEEYKLEANKSLSTIIDKNTIHCKDTLLNIRTINNPNKNLFEIQTLDCMDRDYAWIENTMYTGKRLILKKHYDKRTLRVQLNENSIIINDHLYQERTDLFSSLLSGSYEILINNQIIGQVIINEKGELTENQFIQEISFIDMAGDEELYRNSILPNTDFVRVKEKNIKRLITYELLRVNDGFELHNRMTSAFFDAEAEDPNFNIVKGLHYKFKKVK